MKQWMCRLEGGPQVGEVEVVKLGTKQAKLAKSVGHAGYRYNVDISELHETREVALVKLSELVRTKVDLLRRQADTLEQQIEALKKEGE